MTRIEIHCAWPDDIVQRIEAVFAAHGFSQTLKGTLRGFPGCTHWHFKNGREAGTLEVTAWPSEQRLWLSVQYRRRAKWIDQTLPTLKRELERTLGDAN